MAPAEVKPSPHSDLQGARILVVEDEALIAMELCQALEALGWEAVGPAASVEEALQRLADAPLPDAAVLDVNLGGSLVYPLADRLQALGVPFVFCTGYERLENHDRFAASPVFRKPVNVALLTDALRRAQQAA